MSFLNNKKASRWEKHPQIYHLSSTFKKFKELPKKCGKYFYTVVPSIISSLLVVFLVQDNCNKLTILADVFKGTLRLSKSSFRYRVGVEQISIFQN